LYQPKQNASADTERFVLAETKLFQYCFKTVLKLFCFSYISAVRTVFSSTRSLCYLLNSLTAKLARKKDYDSHDDGGDRQSKADTIKNRHQHAPFTVVRERLARGRVCRVVAPWRLFQSDSAAVWRVRTETRRVATAQKYTREYVVERLQEK